MSAFELANGERVGVLVSGGLSSLAVAAWLADRGADVQVLVADIGQPDHEQPRPLAERLNAAGLATTVVDLRADIAEACLDVVTAQARYEGGYWNTTGISRAVLVRGVAPILRELGCDVLAHGAVGGGNDQARFERYAAHDLADVRPAAVWTWQAIRAELTDRWAMATFLADRGLLSDPDPAAANSTEGNLGGVSHEGASLERLDTPSTVVRPFLTVWPHQASAEPEVFRVRFARGRPVAIDDEAVEALACMQTANAVGGRHGLGLCTVVENRVNGTKCRGVYEAPGMELLGACAELLYQVALGKEAYRLHGELAVRLGRWIYEGRLNDPAADAARHAMERLVQHAEGTVEVEVYRGNVAFGAVDATRRSAEAVRQTRFTHGGQHWEVRDVQQA